MIAKEHIYNVTVRWTGDNGTGASDYRSYTRNHIISARNKPDISASSDPVFRGDDAKYNPEELLLASVSGCHMLWFLHFCADSGVVVVDYIDNPIGIMIETANGSGKFVIRHKTTMPRTAFRYAIEKMPLEMKAKAMKK